ncbi:mannitol dehydrogenase family protein [Ancylobacter oerskovii]|uniref:Mannitol dehydrogenase family protein n=1 Tax=Ancylobacter oerskovii TaxID=459519 RepID=A0ABW4YY09_9HYPH|nr:mannitol dehydrogenase family protein [Ancylobacter oerskovii]MBS7541782.1 mannitol dehydrogenase family protein [Ancylobacter oerskovii]
MTDTTSSFERLDRRSLPRVRARLPGFDPARVGTGIVHIGLGAFVRAHVAAFNDEAMEASGDLSWGLTGVSLRSPDQKARLEPQDGLYTAVERGPGGSHARIIGSLTAAIHAPSEGERLAALLADPATRIVSLTITEKGYCHDPATGHLRADHPEIRADLAAGSRPATAPGLIVAALAARRAAGLAPFTVLCCDNLPGNGHVTRRVVTEYAALKGEALAVWIEREVAFPSTMVDRIVPAVTPEGIAATAELIGLRDEAPVLHEPFRQWVIEDNFPSGRPRWDLAGAQMTTDVEPFELMKLRMLNGTHSAMAYLGTLAGVETVSAAIADPDIGAFVEALWREEIIPTVPPPPGADLAAYAAQLRARYENPGVRHLTAQIAMDGSQKLPQRILAPIRDRMAAGQGIERLALVVAAFLRHARGTSDAGAPLRVSDPLAPLLASAAAPATDAAGYVRRAVAIEPIFGTLGANPTFTAAVTDAYVRLSTHGTRATLRGLAHATPTR